MLYEIMLHIKNFFPTDIREEAEYIIEDGSISLPFITDGAYIKIEGSLFNDGVYKYPCTGLTNETFRGVITQLAPPKQFLDLCDQIKVFNTKDSANISAFRSESFGGYSYTRATSANGGLADWHDVFRGKLNVWRKL